MSRLLEAIASLFRPQAPLKTEQVELEKIKISVLVEEYKLFKQEIWKYMDHWKASVRYLHLVVWSGAVICGFVVTHKEMLPSQSNVLIWVAGLFSFWFIIVYTSHSVLEAEYWNRVISAHMFGIETRLARYTKERVLAWESEFAGGFLAGNQVSKAVSPTNVLIVCRGLGVGAPRYTTGSTSRSRAVPR